uniref:Uncharacterized protein n=1 Tax=Arundo donax TaxID=35708 RepID=A0A0A8ZWX8_ARUDO
MNKYQISPSTSSQLDSILICTTLLT